MTVRLVAPWFARHTSCVKPMSRNWSRRHLQVLCLSSSLHRGRLRLGEGTDFLKHMIIQGQIPILVTTLWSTVVFAKCQGAQPYNLVLSCEKSHLLNGALCVWRAHSRSLTWRCHYSPTSVVALKAPKVDFLSFLCPILGLMTSLLLALPAVWGFPGVYATTSPLLPLSIWFLGLLFPRSIFIWSLCH